MQVQDLGNVTECNRLWIFLNNEGKQDRVKANKDRLESIYIKAVKDYSFYSRMWEEIRDLYDREKDIAERKYHYVTDDEVNEAWARDRKQGFYLSLEQGSRNEEYVRQFGRVHGIYEGANYASHRQWEAHKLKAQAEDALKHFVKSQ